MKRISMTKEWNEKDLEKMEPSEIAATLNFYRSKVIALQRDARLESLLGKEPKHVYSVFSDWGSYDDWGRTLEKVFSDEDDAKKYVEEFEKNIENIKSLIPKDPTKEESFWEKENVSEIYTKVVDEYLELRNKAELDYYKSIGKDYLSDTNVIDFYHAEDFNRCVIEKSELN